MNRRNIRRIVLLDPPFFRFLNEDQRSVPLGLAYLAAALRAKGFQDVVIYNADFNPHQRLGVCNRGYYDEMNRFEEYLAAVTNDAHPIYREVVSTIADCKPDLVGISSRTAKFFITRTIIRLLKETLGDDVPIVVGGPHATANPEHVLIRTQADYVVRGEGEHSMVELAMLLDGGGGRAGNILRKDIAGLSYRQDGHEGQVIHNPARPLIQDLDTIPFPDRSRILHSHMMPPNDFGNIFSSRGCPFACAFCDARTTWSRQVRRHSPGYIADEILDIRQKYGTSFFSFQDDCFVTRPEHTIALCEAMQERGLAGLPKTEFRWWCEIHPNMVSEGLIGKMKAANCVAVAIGAESGSQRTLDAINKSSSQETIRRAARIIRDAGLSLSVFFMIGFPWETESDIQETLSFMEEIEPDNPTVSVLTPLPGTEIARYCRERNLIQYDEDYLTLFHQRSSHFYSDRIPDERSQSIIRDAMLRCENLARRKRREKISRFVRDYAAPDVLEREGIRLEVLDADGQALPNDWTPAGEAVPPRIGVILDQSYTSEKVIVRLTGRNNGQTMLSDASCDRLGKMILKEFPQYAAVEVHRGAADDGVKPRTVLYERARLS